MEQDVYVWKAGFVLLKDCKMPQGRRGGLANSLQPFGEVNSYFGGVPPELIAEVSGVEILTLKR